MVISIQDLCNNCKIASSFISPNPNINIPDNDEIILLGEGGIETDITRTSKNRKYIFNVIHV